MSIRDEYMEDMLIKNNTYLNAVVKPKDDIQYYEKPPSVPIQSDVTLTQQVYLALLTIFALKLLTVSMYK